jgi:hypothetical protein
MKGKDLAEQCVERDGMHLREGRCGLAIESIIQPGDCQYLTDGRCTYVPKHHDTEYGVALTEQRSS